MRERLRQHLLHVLALGHPAIFRRAVHECQPRWTHCKVQPSRHLSLHVSAPGVPHPVSAPLLFVGYAVEHGRLAKVATLLKALNNRPPILARMPCLSVMATFLYVVFLVLVFIPAWIASVVANVTDGTPGSVLLAAALPLILATAGGLVSALWSLMRGQRWP